MRIPAGLGKPELNKICATLTRTTRKTVQCVCHKIEL